MATEEKKKTEKDSGGTLMELLRRWIQGRSFLTLSFFKRNWMYVIAITVMLLMNISNKYECQGYLQQVINYTQELNDARTDCVNASASYNSKIRESQMKILIDTMHIDLATPDQPPYKLTEK